MKKVFTLILALAFGFGLIAQTTLTQAVDFTATDIHGTEVHLFDILDSGQAVVIDFFFVNCGPCQQATPKVVESYYTMGCNMHDVFYIEISDRDSDAACLNWVNNYGVEYPTISGAAGGAGISNTYHIGGFPTVILIMPNHEIVIRDLWPISNAQTIVNALGQHGVMPHDCNGPVTYDPQVALSIDEVTENSITATFTPNEDCASYYYVCATEAEIMLWYATGGDIETIVQEHGISETATLTSTFNDLLPETEYYVAALPVDPDGNYGEPIYETITTLPIPVVYDETLTFSMDTIELLYATATEITVYNNTAEDAVIHSIQETNEWNNFCLITFFINDEEYLCPDNLEISLPRGDSLTMFMVCDMVGKNEPEYIEDLVTMSSNLPDASFMVMVEHAWSVDENEASASLFPNPANESVTLKGENLGMVCVFNILGQKVDEFETNGTELRINTTRYENGIYFVKAGEQTLRFVVKH